MEDAVALQGIEVSKFGEDICITGRIENQNAVCR